MSVLRWATMPMIALVGLSSILPAQAGLVSAPASVALTASRQPSLALELTGGSNLSIADLRPGLNDFPTPVGVRSRWDLAETAVVTLVGYFDNAGGALVGPSASISASEVEGSLGGGAYAPFTGSSAGGVGVEGASLALFQHTPDQLSGERHDDVFLRINVTNPLLPAGVYSGTLNLRLVVQ